MHERSKALQVHEIVRISDFDLAHRKVRLRQVKCIQHSSEFFYFVVHAGISYVQNA